MAISDWDIAAWDDKGRPTGTRFSAGPGRALEIYKASLRVEDEGAWREDGDFSCPTVASLDRSDAGLHEISGFRILVDAGRSRQHVLRFLAAWDGPAGPCVVGGIACYGWTQTFDILAETCRRYGVRMGAREDWWSVTENGSQSFQRGTDMLVWWRGRDDEQAPSADIRPGVQPVDHESFLAWAQNVADGADDALRAGPALARWLDAVRASGCLRISQGDARFADHMGLNELPFTPPGEAEMPMLNVALGMGEGAPIRRMPHRPLSEWLDERALLAHLAGKLRPGLTRAAAPAVRRRLDATLARMAAERGWNLPRRGLRQSRPPGLGMGR